MRSKDFIREAGRNGSSEFDVDPNAKRADTPDWLKNAGKWLGNKIGLKEPVALPDYTASDQQDAAAKSNYRGIDPIQRQKLGMAPATQQEIDAYVKAHPPVIGGVTDRYGNPIVSGAAQELERAARAAGPSRRADFDVDSYAGAPDPKAVGDRFYTPRELGFQPGGTMPAEKKAAAAAPAAAAPAAAAPAAAAVPAAPSSATVQGGAASADSRLSKAPPVAVAQPISTTPIKTEPIVAVDGDQTAANGPKLNRLTGKIDGENSEQDAADAAALAQIKANAGLAGPSAIPSAGSQMGPGGLSAAPPPAEGLPVAVKDTLAPVDSGSPGRAANAGVAAAAPASTSDPEEFIRDKSDDKFDRQGRKKTQNKEPVPVQPPVVNKKPTPGGDDKRISGNTIAPEIVIPPGTPGTMLPGVKDSEGRQVWKRPDSSEMGWDTKTQRWFPTGILNPTTKNSGATYPQPGDLPPGTPGTMLPGVKDSEGRQVWRRPDSSEMGWDTKTQRWYPISIFNRKFNSAPQGSQGSEPAPASSSILNRFKTVDAVDAEIKRFLDKGYDMRLPANQQYVNNLTARRAEVAKVRESSDIGRMRLLAGLIKD